MSVLIRNISPAAVELLALPALDALTADQARGAVCVWDGDEEPLAGDCAVDLGERVTGVHWFPRACRTHTGDRAHRALLDHVPVCEECTERKAMCDIGRALYRLATRRAVSGALDLDAMRDAARRILGGQMGMVTDDELELITSRLRGHLMLAIPAVQEATTKHPEGDIPSACALVGVQDARQRLDKEPAATRTAGLAHVQLLARSVMALCDHYESLTGQVTERELRSM
ncbi:DUF6415 family natural product biosynthesis protein [Streptomyces sp. NPDC091377]|uniref:DUF6415 family natural product biosynthesis protein n=1 Tax=Streptomyces sp. NPDC091377 TaxID=3365995 RepID=UPI0037F64343